MNIEFNAIKSFNLTPFLFLFMGKIQSNIMTLKINITQTSKSDELGYYYTIPRGDAYRNIKRVPEVES